MLIGSNTLMNSDNLPYDAEVEYIESTTTQWIDTGVICDQSTDIIFSGRTRTVLTGIASFYFGARTSFQHSAFSACTADNHTQVGFGSFDGQTYLPNISSNSDFIISNSGVNWYLSVGGQTSEITAKTDDFTTPTTLLLFRVSNDGTPDSRSFTGAIYFVKLYHNGTLIRDFIPVRFTNESNQTEGAMYDHVTKKLFRNAGTGTFVIGPDKTSSIRGGEGRYKRKFIRRSYRRSLRPSMQLRHRILWKEVA